MLHENPRLPFPHKRLPGRCVCTDITVNNNRPSSDVQAGLERENDDGRGRDVSNGVTRGLLAETRNKGRIEVFKPCGPPDLVDLMLVHHVSLVRYYHKRSGLVSSREFALVELFMSTMIDPE